MNVHRIWIEQSEASWTIRDRFGVKSALGYLVGEKLMNFAEAADRHPEFAAGLPHFQAAAWNAFNPYELSGYLTTLKRATRRKLQNILLT